MDFRDFYSVILFNDLLFQPEYWRSDALYVFDDLEPCLDVFVKKIADVHEHEIIADGEREGRLKLEAADDPRGLQLLQFDVTAPFGLGGEPDPIDFDGNGLVFRIASRTPDVGR